MNPFIDTPSSFPPVVGSDTADQIEYRNALELVARFAVSECGAASVRQRVPIASEDIVSDELAAVGDLVRVLTGSEAFVPEPVDDVRPILERLEVPGGVLDAGELSALGNVISATVQTVAKLSRAGRDAPRIGRLAVPPPPAELASRIATAIGPDGAVLDKASADLARVRKRHRATRARLVAFLENVMQRLASSMADAGVTQRSSRYVIPVRREARARVKGIVHGESSSGATLFVEPEDAIALGNELSEYEAQEQREVLKVLRDLSDLLRPHIEEIAEGWGMCVRLDDLYARAKYAIEVDAVVPGTRSAPAPLVIRGARHPLLLAEVDRVVPFDLMTDENETVILVSGPNTGGKSVLLKAVGLIHALAQAGVVPPVGAGTTLPVFKTIFADIGDHQSIAASLSTFSGHLEALRGVLQSAERASLVLLDEFGTGTDPSEGAALAGALIKTLCARGCTTIATTHLNQLKRLASETPGVVNASLQFDATRLEPTYRVVKGVPGRSYGLAIAKRLGFPPEVLAIAEELQPDADRSFESLLEDLDVRERELAERERTVDELERRVRAVEEELSEGRADLDARRTEFGDEVRRLETVGRAEARRFLLDARKRVEEALGLARAAVSEATAKEARRLVEEGVRDEASALERLQMEAKKKGWTVRGSGRARARDDEPQPRGAPTARSALETTTASASTEIDVRGMLADDAEVAVVRALDQAVVADLGSLRIIHGKGTGALRHRVSALLQRDRRVVSFGSPPPQQGGWGVTIAELKA